MDLLNLASGYLEAQGYKMVQRQTDFLHGAKPLPGRETHDYLVWVPKISRGGSLRTQENPYVSRFLEASKNFPSAARVMLVDTREGLSSSFRSKATKYHVTVRVPVEFFDTPFRSEAITAKGALSVADSIRDSAKEVAQKRMPQPFTVRNRDKQKQGSDLLDALFRKIMDEQKLGINPSINFIVGPAGIGKSILFNALFRQLYDKFLEYKRQLSLFPRPLPLVPQHLKTATVRNLRGAVESALHTDFELPIEFPAFEWMLTNGFAMWLLDGLDELMSRDPDFYNNIWELITKPHGTVQPTIVICVRDSLLATSDNLRDFCEDEDLEKFITIYELSPWDVESKRAYAEKVLHPSSEAERFMQVINTRPELNDLSSNPYYCSLLVDQFEAGDLQESYTESQLLDVALSSIIQREYRKELLDKVLLPETKLLEFLQALAGEDLDTDFQGVDQRTLREYAEIMVPSDMSQQAIDMLITHLVQIAVFSQAAIAGNIRFSQEILEHYLLGQYLFSTFQSDKEQFLQILSKRLIPSDWITLRVLAEKVHARRAIKDLLILLEAVGLHDNSYRNILQIAAYAVDDTKGLKHLSLKGHDLTGVKFEDMDFNDVSFRQCDLTRVEFRNCKLQGAQFEGSIIKNTYFLLGDPEALRGATFGNMERVYSLIDERGKLQTEQRFIGKWLHDHTGKRPPLAEPCAAAKQLRILFGKFIYPNGMARCAMLNKRACLSGKEYHDREETLDAALRHLYLFEEAERYRERICRCEGDRYQELIGYVKNLSVSPGLERLLNDLCPKKGCSHIPRKR
jgi:hypothetical protein